MKSRFELLTMYSFRDALSPKLNSNPLFFQSHLFDEHRAEDCTGYFVRVCVQQTDKGYFTQKKYIFVCVVCWGKFPSSTDMSSHRMTCKITSPPNDDISIVATAKRRATPNRRSSNASGNRIVEETEPTNVVSTPDIPYMIDSDDEHSNGHVTVNQMSGVSPPKSSSPPEIIVEHSAPSGYHLQQSQPVKRGRKKQLHPQQVRLEQLKLGLENYEGRESFITGPFGVAVQ